MEEILQIQKLPLRLRRLKHSFAAETLRLNKRKEKSWHRYKNKSKRRKRNKSERKRKTRSLGKKQPLLQKKQRVRGKKPQMKLLKLNKNKSGYRSQRNRG